MKEFLIVAILTYVGIPLKSAIIIALMLYVIIGLLILLALISIINTASNTKKITEQNETIIELLKEKNQQEKSDYEDIAIYNHTVYNEEQPL